MRHAIATALKIEKDPEAGESPWAAALRVAVERLELEQGISANVSRPYLEEVASRFASVVAQWRK